MASSDASPGKQLHIVLKRSIGQRKCQVHFFANFGFRSDITLNFPLRLAVNASCQFFFLIHRGIVGGPKNPRCEVSENPPPKICQVKSPYLWAVPLRFHKDEYITDRMRFHIQQNAITVKIFVKQLFHMLNLRILCIEYQSFFINPSCLHTAFIC